MNNFQKEFTRFLIQEKALQFGRFKLKSGKTSPYFFNTSCFNSGNSINKLGQFYAESMQNLLPCCTSVFGPAYKGIPLCISTAIAISKINKKDIGYFFNRKEKKGHGDKGLLVGKKPINNDVVALVDDVITDGQTKIEAINSLKNKYSIQIQAVFIAFDRLEINKSGISASQEFSDKTEIPIHAITSIIDVLSLLKTNSLKETNLVPESSVKDIESYLREYRILF
jgi:orotate phosphoribosyltransferase